MRPLELDRPIAGGAKLPKHNHRGGIGADTARVAVQANDRVWNSARQSTAVAAMKMAVGKSTTKT